MEDQNEAVWRLSNTLLNDAQISFKAKGLFLYMIFSNKYRGFSLDMLKKASHIDSERSIKLAINELERNGYLIKVILKQGEIRWTSNLERNINQKVTTTTSEVEQKQNTVKNNPVKQNTRKRKTTKKAGTLLNFLKEFY